MILSHYEGLLCILTPVIGPAASLLSARNSRPDVTVSSGANDDGPGVSAAQRETHIHHHGQADDLGRCPKLLKVGYVVIFKHYETSLPISSSFPLTLPLEKLRSEKSALIQQFLTGKRRVKIKEEDAADA
ncbi:hypothetical protein GH722_02250 [Alphaproteobacteria bacterium HT1-32]|nr:hypothetical protein [Alphaproteobacteria bacterium HT1-32]